MIFLFLHSCDDTVHHPFVSVWYHISYIPSSAAGSQKSLLSSVPGLTRFSQAFRLCWKLGWIICPKYQLVLRLRYLRPCPCYKYSYDRKGPILIMCTHRHKINKLTYNNLWVSVTFLDFVPVFFSVLPLFLYKSPSFLSSFLTVLSSPLSLLSLSAAACLPVSPAWVLLPPPCSWGPSPSRSSWVKGGHVAKVLSNWQQSEAKYSPNSLLI